MSHDLNTFVVYKPHMQQLNTTGFHVDMGTIFLRTIFSLLAPNT